MTPFLSLLLGRHPTGGVWRVDRFDRERERLAESFAVSTTVIDLDVAAGKTALLDAVAEALDFPDWFGRNWDALHDCLADHRFDEGGEGPQRPLLVLRPVGSEPTTGVGTPSPDNARDLATLVDIVAENARANRWWVLVVGPRPESVPDLAAITSQAEPA